MEDSIAAVSASPSESAAGDSPAPFAKVTTVVTKFQKKKKKKKKKACKRQALKDKLPLKIAKGIPMQILYFGM